MGLFNALEASASALSAERQRAEVVAANLANAESTRTDNGTGPFRRKQVVFSSPGSSRFQLLLTGLNKLTGGRLAGPADEGHRGPHASHCPLRAGPS